MNTHQAPKCQYKLKTHHQKEKEEQESLCIHVFGTETAHLIFKEQQSTQFNGHMYCMYRMYVPAY